MLVKTVFRIVAVLMVILSVSGAWAGIEVEDIDREDASTVVLFLEELTGSIQTGVVKTGLVKGITWEEKALGLLAVVVFTAFGFWIHCRLARRRPVGGWQALSGARPIEESGLKPFSLGCATSREGFEDSHRAFRA